MFLGKNHATTTDEQGRYQFLNVTTGTYTIRVGASKSSCWYTITVYICTYV